MNQSTFEIYTMMKKSATLILTLGDPQRCS